MKPIYILLAIICLSLTFCNKGVPAEEYDRLVVELKNARTENQALKKRVKELIKERNALKYDKDLLLSKARGFFDLKEYKKAEGHLVLLIQKNPGTKEAEEGKLLLKKVRSIMKAQEKKKQVKIQVVNEKRLDYSNVKRIQVTVRVPALSKEKLKEEIKNLCVSYYRRGNHAVAVHVYLMTDKIKGHNWYAMYHFAPGGEWGKAAAGVPFSDYRLKVEFNTEDMRKL